MLIYELYVSNELLILLTINGLIFLTYVNAKRDIKKIIKMLEEQK